MTTPFQPGQRVHIVRGPARWKKAKAVVTEARANGARYLVRLDDRELYIELAADVLVAAPEASVLGFPTQQKEPAR